MCIASIAKTGIYLGVSLVGEEGDKSSKTSHISVV